MVLQIWFFVFCYDIWDGICCEYDFREICMKRVNCTEDGWGSCPWAPVNLTTQLFVLEFFELHPEGLIPLLPCIIMLTKQFVIFETFPIWSVLKLIALPQWTNIIEKSLFVFNNRYQQYLSPFTNATCIFDIKRWIKNNSQIKPSESNLFCLFRIPSDLSL